MFAYSVFLKIAHLRSITATGAIHNRAAESLARSCPWRTFLSSADFLRTRKGGGSSDADVRTFRYKKLRIFRNFWCVRADMWGGG